MADEQTPSKAKTKGPEKVDAADVDLVVGTNQGQAMFLAKTLGLGKRQAVAVDYAVDRIGAAPDGLRVMFTKDPGDFAVDWVDVAEVMETKKSRLVTAVPPERGERRRGRRARRLTEAAG